MVTGNEEFPEEQETVFDWKKKGFDNQERLTLKTNTKEAEAYNARKKNQPLKTAKITPETLPLGLQKLRKKIREVYDEDDEDENDTIFAFMPLAQEEDNKLLNGLTDDEKRFFKQKDVINTTKMQQDAGKMEAMHIANNMARDLGLKNLNRKVLDKSMQEATFRPEEMQQKVIKKEVSQKLGIKGNVDSKKVIQAARGIKKVEKLGGKEAAKNLDMRDVIKAGEEKLDDIKLAELILEKSGQDIKKRKQRLQQGKEKIELKNLEAEPKKDKSDIARGKNIDLSR